MKSRDKQHFGITDHFVAHRKSKRTFLDDVDALIDWKPIEKFLDKKLHRKANTVGSPAFPSLMMFKILLLQKWYGLSDPAMEAALYDRISFVKFIKSSLEVSVPDETTICRFRNGLVTLKIFDDLLNLVNIQFENKELFVREGAIIDASVVGSSQRPRKSIDVLPQDRSEDDTQKNNPSAECCVNHSKDKDAKWLCKGKKVYYGYKIHTSVDSKLGLVLAANCTGANTSDTSEFIAVVKKTNLHEGASVFADKGYCSKANTEFLERQKLDNKIMIKAKRNKELSAFEKYFNKVISKTRFIVERTFGCVKQHFNFHRTRYMGCDKVQAEFMLISMAHNIKKAVNACG